MLIDTLLSLSREAAQFPFFMWEQNFIFVKKTIIHDLEEIESTLSPQETLSTSAQKLNFLIKFFKNDYFEESMLAQEFFALGEIFSASKIQDDKIQQYLLLVNTFIKRVEKEQSFSHLRDIRKKKMSQAQQAEYDRKLFASEGLFYCLIYYLTYYKTLSDIKDANLKKAYIEQEEINFGTGKIMGIKQDFTRDECLEKFVLFILSDKIRTNLLVEYYLCKQTILSSKNFMEVEAALHDFIRVMLVLFDEHQVVAANNGFLAPYGKKTTIKELLILFLKDYVPGQGTINS